MPKHPFSIPELADSLLDDLRCAAREEQPVNFLRNVSGPGARAWLFALADRTAVKAWLAAQPDPIDLAVCFSPGQDLLMRYLVSLVPQTQKDPPHGVPAWDDLAWVAPFLRRIDAIVEYARASGRHLAARAEIIALVDQAAETARLWRIFVYPDTRPGDVVYRTLFHHVAGMIEMRPQEVAAELRAYHDRAQALLGEIAPPAGDLLATPAAAPDVTVAQEATA
ncbi:hypothetical protein SE17_04390 [Kouleothrix aurantiaca]|uniref:Uncharacterized protein n=1 Tax=Kouleothrix aurantiaca TaxID=186479 RepID=A0A0P9FC97_9CHLR|nr:hypothetical protein SE17_04390 [Kouleothrix aurantiaca]